MYILPTSKFLGRILLSNLIEFVRSNGYSLRGSHVMHVMGSSQKNAVFNYNKINTKKV